MSRSIISAFIVAIAAFVVVPAASAQAPKLLYNKQVTVEPGQQFRSVLVGRNISVTQDINCGQSHIVGSTVSENIGSEGKSMRLRVRAWSLPCTVSVQVYTSQAQQIHTVCFAFKTRPASKKPFVVPTC